MIALGLDPGSRILGYGLVDWGAEPRFILGGTIEATKKDSPALRIREIGDGLRDLLGEFKTYGITRVGIESGYVSEVKDRKSRNHKAELMLANARGVALYLATSILGIEPIFVAPSTVKKAATGSGNAEKEQVMEAVKAVLRMNRRPSADTADALAVAIAAAGQG